LSPPPPSSLALIKLANPGSPEMAVKMEKEMEREGEGERETNVKAINGLGVVLITGA